MEMRTHWSIPDVFAMFLIRTCSNVCVKKLLILLIFIILALCNVDDVKAKGMDFGIKEENCAEFWMSGG